MIQFSEIKPLSIFLPDDKSWMEKYYEAKEYFISQGLDVYWVEGIHAQKWGIQGRHIYLLDNRPQEQFYVGDKNVGIFLSWYHLFGICKGIYDLGNTRYTHFLLMEMDCRFIEGWREKLAQALLDVPEDFDFLFIGSCCAEDKEPVHVKGDVYEFTYRGEDKWNWYPQCGHCNLISAKALQALIDTQRDVANPIDISLIKYAFPQLKIYAVLPRIADQGVSPHTYVDAHGNETVVNHIEP